MNYWEKLKIDESLKLLQQIEQNHGIELNPEDVITKLVGYY